MPIPTGKKTASLPAEDITDAVRRVEILQRVMAAISSGLALDPLLSDILEGAVELTGAAYGTIGVVVERSGTPVVRMVAVHNLPEEELNAEMPSGFTAAAIPPAPAPAATATPANGPAVRVPPPPPTRSNNKKPGKGKN